jgi:hypothetical protein
MKRYPEIMGGMILIVAMTGCCYSPGYIDPMSGIPYGGSWEAASGGPLDPAMYLGNPAMGNSFDCCGTTSPYQRMPTPYLGAPASYIGYSSGYMNPQSNIGVQPILPSCPFWWLFAPLFGCGPSYSPYMGADSYTGADCCGEYYNSTPPTYILPGETLKPQPAPPADEPPDPAPAETTPMTFSSPALLPR